MFLTIDIGNTFTKCAIFNGQDEIIAFEKFLTSDAENFVPEYLDKIDVSVQASITCSIGLSLKSIEKRLNKIVSYNLELTHNTPLPFKLKYATPNTLGYDRIAAAAGANALYPNQPALIIDAGSAITIDFISENNEFLGGNISPGLEMRYRALNEFTAQLPKLSKSGNSTLTGGNTKQAIINGVENGIIFELNSYITKFREMNKDVKIILTGGDAIFFDKKLKKPIFVDLNLVDRGLNNILKFNVENR